MWVLDPFTYCGNPENKLSALKEDNLIELTSDRALKEELSNLTLPTFWSKMSKEYPKLSEKAIKRLLPFPSTYLCESAFSIMTSMKTKARNRLDVTTNLRVAISNIQPRFDKLVSDVQAQRSH